MRREGCAAEAWAEEREVLLAVYSNECCELCDGEGGAGGALEVVLAAPSDCIDAPWVRARVEVGPAGARVAQAQGLAEGEATELLTESLREALDFTCAEPPGVWLAVLSALSERLDARAASAAGACDDGARCCACDEPLGRGVEVERPLACLHRCHSACLQERWQRQLAEGRPASCPACQLACGDSDLRRLGVEAHNSGNTDRAQLQVCDHGGLQDGDASEPDQRRFDCAFVWFHHIYSSKKIAAIADSAKAHAIGGLLKCGSPGVLICEGRSGRNKDDIGAFLKEISCLSWQAMSVRANMPGRDGEARRLHERLCRVRDEGMGDLADALAKADSSMLGTFKTAILKM